MRPVLIALRLALIGWLAVGMACDVSAWADKRIKKAQDEILGGSDRYVDFGIVMHIVRQDLINGTVLLDGAPRMVVLDTKRFGGMVDTRTMSLCGPSEDPAVWYVSEDQARLILHGSDLQDRLLVYGSEGGGKTVTLAMWCALRTLEFTGASPRREIGMTAPTGPRLKIIQATIQQWWPARWIRWVERDSCFYVANGVTVRLISTHQTSAKEGSRVQGYNWSACGSDELQDSIDRDEDIESRGRSAPNGRYKRLATATAKDHSEWRTWRDAAIANGMWGRTDLLSTRSPFIHPDFLERLKRTLSKREWTRRQGAQDVPPERVVYYNWDRARNVAPRPRVEHAAQSLLSGLGGPFGLLIGHDPGRRYRYSVFLLPWIINNRRKWWVVDEVWNDTGTIESHVLAVRQRVREKWGCNLLDRFGKQSPDSPRALIRTDIYTDNGEDSKRPDRSVYTLFRQHGMFIMPAAQRATPGGQLRPAQIRKDSRINMVNRLFADANGEPCLFVDVDEFGKPVAPKLIHAIESMERDGNDRAEAERKGSMDLSHFTAALGYGLWSIEKPKVSEMRPDDEELSPEHAA